LLGFSFGGGIDPNNVNDLACRFKSPCNHTQLDQGENFHRQSEASRRKVFGKPAEQSASSENLSRTPLRHF
jgi:hypothetical protein